MFSLRRDFEEERSSRRWGLNMLRSQKPVTARVFPDFCNVKLHEFLPYQEAISAQLSTQDFFKFPLTLHSKAEGERTTSCLNTHHNKVTMARARASFNACTGDLPLRKKDHPLNLNHYQNFDLHGALPFLNKYSAAFSTQITRIVSVFPLPPNKKCHPTFNTVLLWLQ